MNASDFQALLKMAGPIIGTAAAGDGVGRGAFMNAFQQGRDIARQEKAQRDQEMQRKQQAAAKFLMDVGSHTEQFDDPVALNEYVHQIVAPAYEAGGFGPASDLIGRFTVSDSKVAAKRNKELQAAYDAVTKQYDPEQLRESNAHVQLADGSQIPFGQLEDHLNPQVTAPSGERVPRSKKAAPRAGTIDERAAQLLEDIDAATAKGDTATAAAKKSEYDRILKAKKDLGEAGRVPRLASGGVDAQFDDLVALWKVNHGGQEPDTKTRTDLRMQANRVNDRPRELGGMNALYSASDPQAIADAIMRGERAPDTAGLGRPIGAAVDSVLAKSGFNQAQAVTDWKATQRHLATLNGSQQLRLNQAINALPEMLDSVDALAAKWKGGRFALLNKANLALAKGGAYGPQAASIANQLDAQIADVVADLGNVYMGGNSPTDHALSLAGKSLSGEWDEKVLRDMVSLAKKNVVIRRNSIANTGVAGASAGNPYAPQPPSVPRSSGLSGTVRMRAPNGQEKDVPADQVEHYKQRGAVVVK